MSAGEERLQKVERWRILAHRAIDDAFFHETGVRVWPGGPLTVEELAEFNRLDVELGALSQQVKVLAGRLL